ncbi:MAG: ChbG/HpnK family deacetylase [Terracidiphilus sp.]
MRRECDQDERKCIPLGSVGDERTASGSRTTHPEAHGLILNADDWGLNRETTDRTLDCARCGAISSASAMVFMDDSERAACLASDNDVDTGLHLNLTTPFQSSASSSSLRENQRRVITFLRQRRMNQAIYHPGLAGSFEYVVRAQLDEYGRLYQKPPRRIDGHHHMHLCANIQFQNLLPEGTIVRRNFSFGKGEKTAINRLYRRWQDRHLARRHQIADFFFSLPPMNIPGRLEKIFALAIRSIVEIETHPENREDFEFLMSGDLMACARRVGIATSYSFIKC